MSEPLRKPQHLRPVSDTTAAEWLARRKAAVAAGVLGVASFAVVAITAGEPWATIPDWRVSVPGVALTALASLVSLLRREPGGYWIWGLGLGLAAASLVLGWFLMVAIVIGAAIVLIAVLHAVM